MHHQAGFHLISMVSRILKYLFEVDHVEPIHCGEKNLRKLGLKFTELLSKLFPPWPLSTQSFEMPCLQVS